MLSLNPGSSPTVSLPSLLIVDDDVGVLRAFSRSLRRAYRVVTAESVSAALSVLDEERFFDAVLCDVNMPGRLGVELHAVVQTLIPALGARFIWMTGDADCSKAYGLSGEVVLEKPFDLADLERALDSVGGRVGDLSLAQIH